LREWQELGVRRTNGSALPAVDIEGRIVRPDGPQGPAYLVYGNYDVLLKWNRSNYFASAVVILADRLRTAPTRVASALR
jgi:membrane-bound lytic murein transglycosylase B